MKTSALKPTTGAKTASKTATSTKTATATKTSTEAYTQGNVTVTGGAGAGSTTVHIGGQPPKPTTETGTSKVGTVGKQRRRTSSTGSMRR